MSAWLTGLPPDAAELLADDWPPDQLEHLHDPERRDLRRRALDRKHDSAFREALRAGGWRRGQIRRWLRTGLAPNELPPAEPRP